MEFEEAFKVLDDLVFAKAGRRLDQVEKLIIEAAWSDKDYKEIAEESPYTVDRLQRDVGRKLWILLTGILGNGGKVTKKRLRTILERTMIMLSSHSLSDTSESSQPNTLSKVIGGQPPDISSFHGRVPELAMLRESIIEDQCLALIGAAGIGKSALAAKLIEAVSAEPVSEFECVIWKSIHYAPPLEYLMAELIKLLAAPSELDLPESAQARVSVLIEFLCSRRCLLVLDAAEAVLQGNRNTGFNPYGEKYADYGMFFRRLVEEQHQSCLVLTSRSPFIDVTQLQRKGQPARTVKIEGLGKEAMQILRAKGLTDESEWGDLIQTYRGNPLALQLVASRIQEFFGGSVEEFIKYNTTYVTDIFQTTLDEQFGATGRLTDLERQVMVYLAESLGKEVDSMTFTQLLNNLKIQENLKVSTSELIEALEALDERSLIEKNKSASGKVILTLQPVVKKYVLTDPLGLVHAPF